MGTHPNRVQNALQAIALSHGLRRGSSLWSEAGQQAIASLSLTRYTAERRTALQSLYQHLEEQIEDLDRKVEELAWQPSGTAADDSSGSRTDHSSSNGNFLG